MVPINIVSLCLMVATQTGYCAMSSALQCLQKIKSIVFDSCKFDYWHKKSNLPHEQNYQNLTFTLTLPLSSKMIKLYNFQTIEDTSTVE